MIGERSLVYRALNALVHIALLLAALSSLLPFMHIVSLSLSSQWAVQSRAVGLWPVQPHMDNYVYAFLGNQVAISAAISVARVLLGVTLSLAVIVLTAYPLSQDRIHMPGRTAFKMVMLFSMLFSGGLIPYFLSMRNLGLYDNPLVLVVPQALNIFYVIVAINFFRGIPPELAEAAVVDGASHLDVLTRVYLPVSMPVLATIALFSAVQHWNSWFDGILFIRQTTMWPLQSLAYQRVIQRSVAYAALSGNLNLQATQITAEGLTAAFVMIAAVPIMLVYPFLQRYFLTGLTLGSVKG